MTSVRGNDTLNSDELVLVRAAMRRKCLSQSQLSKECQLSRSAISQILSGDIAPTSSTREHLAFGLDLDFQEQVMESARIINRLRQ